MFPVGLATDGSDRADSSRWRFGFRAGAGLGWQVIVVVIAWAFLASLRADSDGLWFQGDAPRHAMNGLFWKDLLQRLPADPRAFALRYYARYPAINPVSYPPFFYLVEAGGFAVFGPSASLPKRIVLGFCLVEAVYALAWLRRWVGKEAGYVAALVPVVPAMATWSSGVMLNVPACALTLAAAYHARRWLEQPASRQLYVAACLSTLAVLTYFQAAALVPIIVAWVVATGNSRLLIQPRTIAVAAVCGVALLPSLLLAVKWAPVSVKLASSAPGLLSESSPWLHYLWPAWNMLGPTLATAASVGFIAGMISRRWRFETVLLLIWVVLNYGFVTIMHVKDPRYLLPLTPPLLFLASICLVAIPGVLERIGGGIVAPVIVVTAPLLLLIILGWQARRMVVPSPEGFREVAEFLRRVAPAEPVLYDGHYAILFTFYVRLADTDRRQMVVRGDKLFYVSDIQDAVIRPRSLVSSPEEVVAMLRTRAGCRWLAIERGTRDAPTAAYRFLREAVEGPLFKRVRSFPITAPSTSRIDLYQIQTSIERPTEYELSVPLLGQDARIKVRPE